MIAVVFVRLLIICFPASIASFSHVQATLADHYKDKGRIKRAGMVLLAGVACLAIIRRKRFSLKIEAIIMNIFF